MAEFESTVVAGGDDRDTINGSWVTTHARELLDSTDEGILALNSSNLCTFANASGSRMLGYKSEKIVGADIHTLLYQDSLACLPGSQTECPICRTMRTGEAVRITTETLHTRDNNPLTVEYRVRPIFEEGTVAGAVMNFRAIAGHKQPEERFEEWPGRPDEQTANALENITDAFYVLDREWRFVYANSQVARLLQRSKEELLGKSLWEEFPEATSTNFRTQLHRALAEQVMVETEDYYPSLQSWFEARAYPSEYGLSVYFLDITDRKKAAEECERLLEAAERHAADRDAVIHSITDAVYIGDVNGIRACNDTALAMLGFESLAEVNQNIHTLAERLQNRFARTGDRIPAEEEPFARALNGETVIEEVLSRHLKTGHDIVLRCAAAPIWGDDEILGAVAVNTDVTERRKAEQELRESELFVRSTLDSLSAHVAILDEAGFILATNRAWQEFGSSNSPIAGNTRARKNYLEVCDSARGEGSEGAKAFARGIRDVIAGRRKSFDLEYPCHSPEERRWFLGKVTRFPDTHPPKIVVAHENVTERNLAVQEIKLRARQQESVADLGRNALSEPDLSILMNKAVELVSKTLEAKYCGLLELLPGGDELLLRAGTGWREGLVGSATVSAGADSQAGYTLISDGPVILRDSREEKWLSGSSLVYGHGVVSGMSTVIRGHKGAFGVLATYTADRRVFTGDDVNFLRAVANVLGEAIEWRKAEEKMRGIQEAERSRMARDFHDGPLQNLTYALATTQLVQARSKDPELDYWLENAVEAMKLTGQELQVAVYDLRLEEHREKPFSELVESLVKLNRKMTPDRNISLNMSKLLPGNPLGNSDPELLRILQEALTNSRRHSEARNVAVGLDIDGPRLWAQVEDDGCGFGPEVASGLGLSSMRERAHALGGNLNVESKPGRGTRVRFTVTHENKDNEQSKKTAPKQQIRVLLIDDHVSFRNAASMVLEQEGCTVEGEAGTLAEVRKFMDGGALEVDVVLVDLDLPDGDGGDLITEIRETNPQAQVLVLSATLDRTEMARAVESGAAGILHKSAGMDEVLKAIRRLLAGEALLSPGEVIELLRLSASHRARTQEVREAIARLTPREIEVLETLAEGLDGKEIARRLRISDKTERNHIASIMTKLGVHSRLQALVFALRYGITDVRRGRELIS